jgi:hypothetical protein
MGMAAYDIQGSGKSWSIFHDGNPEGNYDTREAAFEAALAAASPALREGHEVRVTVQAETTLLAEPLSTLAPRRVT